MGYHKPLKLKTMKAEQINETLNNIRAFNFCRCWKWTLNIGLNAF